MSRLPYQAKWVLECVQNGPFCGDNRVGQVTWELIPQEFGTLGYNECSTSKRD